jgi:UDP-N-acetylmuramoyl-tripeptide--D-alanyl-D-alanine ligase
VLSKNFKTHATSGNFNNHIGVPLTLLSMPKDTELAIIEMGANHLGEIAELCRMSEPNYGIITSIGRAHLEGFGSLQGVIDTKTELYRFVEQSAGKVFVNADNELLMDLSKELDRITYGQNLKADIQAKLLNTTAFATAQWNGNTIQSQLVGAYNFDNMMAAIAMGKYFEITTEQIVEALQEYEPQNKRSQWQKTEKNELIIDAYNANPSSMEAALKSFESIEASNKWLILGDMLELGAESDAEHQKLVEQLLSHPEFKFILVGAEMLKAAKGKSVHAFADTTEAITWIDQHPINQSLILLKGSRGIALEKLIAYL